MYRLSKHVIMYAGRKILKVYLPSGFFFAFYQSSGRNSGKPGTWFPFDGVLLNNHGYRTEWFNKRRFVDKGDDSLHRYGSHELRKISDYLDKFEFKDYTVVETPEEVNEFIFGKNWELKSKLSPKI